MCRGACPVSPGNRSAAVGRDFVAFPALTEDFQRRFPKRSRMQNAPEAQAEIHYLDLVRDRDARSNVSKVRRRIRGPSPRPL